MRYTRFTESDVEEVRAKYNSGNYSIIQLSGEYGRCEASIKKMIRKRRNESNWMLPHLRNRHDVVSTYKWSAKKRNLTFSLADEQIDELFHGLCHYCGAEPSTVEHRQAPDYPFTYNGIDRKDNYKGYEPDNVVSCCTRCNRMKGVLGYDEFISHIIRMADLLRKE